MEPTFLQPAGIRLDNLGTAKWHKQTITNTILLINAKRGKTTIAIQIYRMLLYQNDSVSKRIPQINCHFGHIQHHYHNSGTVGCKPPINAIMVMTIKNIQPIRSSFHTNGCGHDCAFSPQELLNFLQLIKIDKVTDRSLIHPTFDS